MQDTTEEYLPSSRAATEKGHKCPFNPTAQTAKNVGMVIQCQECGKWRCLHAKKKLSGPKRNELEVLLEMLLYSCGSIFEDIDIGDEQYSVVNDVCVRANLSFKSQIELSYYSAGYEAICIHCGEDTMLVEREGFYPQCQGCENKQAVQKRGRTHIV